MKTVFEHIRQHLLEGCGISDQKKRVPDLPQLQQTEWSSKFETLMRNRLVMGYFRYGPLKPKGKKVVYDRVSSMRQRLDLYESEGNAEHLVDIANLCLAEFVHETHPNFHFRSADDQEHAKEARSKELPAKSLKLEK